jgi:hypothetical protein
MRIRTDDEVYRVDAVWLGPPKATMPWRVRYVAWGVGTVVFLLVMTVERRIGVPFGWSQPWHNEQRTSRQGGRVPGHEPGPRKVRTPEGRVVANGNPR